MGKGPHAAQSALTQKNLNSEILGSGGTVVAQVPEAGTKVPPGSTVMLFTDEASQSEQVVVPDVRGKSGLAANQMILNAGLNIRVTGVGVENQYAVAAKQDIAGGTKVPRGTVITVDFANSSMQNIY